MGKILEDSLGTFENVFILVTCVCVMYLVAKGEGWTNIRITKGDGFFAQTAGVLGYNQVDDAANRAGYYPGGRVEGFSDGSMEPPVFHMTPFDPEELDQVSFEQSASGVDYGNTRQAVWKARPKVWTPKKKSQYDTKFANEVTSATPADWVENQYQGDFEGMSYGRIRNGMTDSALMGAASGLNRSL